MCVVHERVARPVRPRFVRLCFLLVLGVGASGSDAEPLTLEQAWALAEHNNPALRSAQAKLNAAQGERTDSRALLFNNPTLSTQAGPRRIQEGAGANVTTNDWSVALSQTVELWGQPGARRDAAERALDATREDIAEARRQVRAEVERRFVAVLSLQTRIELEGRAVALIETAAAAVRRRVSAGQDSRLEGNLATVEAERGRNQLAQLEEELVRARAALATALQAPERELPQVAGTLEPRLGDYTLDALLDGVALRPGMRAVTLREQAARSRLDLERAERYPDVTLGVSQYKEGTVLGKDLITLFSVSVPLPLFRQNAAGVGRAVTELSQASLDRSVFERDARSSVVALWEQREKLKARVARLSDAMLPRLEENLKLSQASLAAGAIGVTEWILAQRQVLEGQRDLVEARTGLRLAQVDLEAAAGWSQPESWSR